VGGDAARDWSAPAIERGIDLGFSLSPARVRGDPLLLPELLDNLIDNALRYTPAGGVATVSTGVRDHAPYLSVEDTGPGIAAAERDKVVEFPPDSRHQRRRIGGSRDRQEIVDRHAGTSDRRTRRQWWYARPRFVSGPDPSHKNSPAG
jgi:K+-sensing histidine kinase KdpD